MIGAEIVSGGLCFFLLVETRSELLFDTKGLWVLNGPTFHTSSDHKIMCVFLMVDVYQFLVSLFFLWSQGGMNFKRLNSRLEW